MLLLIELIFVPILITKQLANEKAESEYEKFKEQQRLLEKDKSIDELEKDLKKLKGGNKK